MPHFPTSRRGILAAGSLLVAATSALPAMSPPLAAQPAAGSFPERPMRLIVPYAPGGLTDITARLVGEGVARILGQSVVVENRPGANSIIGAGATATSSPDGYTLAMVIGAHAANATLYAGRLPFHPINSFAPVSHVVTTPLILASGPQFPVRDLQGLIALAKERPERIAYGSSGVGSAAHLAMEDLMLRTGARMVHSPYRGTQPALQDLLAGRIGAMFDVFPGFAPHLAAGSIRGLGVASAERQGFAPDVPTLIEGGLPDFVASTWCLLLAPANTPPAIVRRISDAAAALLREPATGPRLEALGLAPVGSTPEEATAFLREEIDRWGRVIRAADVRVD